MPLTGEGINNECDKINHEALQRHQKDAALVRAVRLARHNRNATILRARLLEGVALLHGSGATLSFQRECWPGESEADLPPREPISDTVLEAAAAQINMTSRFKHNEELMKRAFQQRVTLEGFSLKRFLSRSLPAIKNGRPLKELEPVHLSRDDGPRLVVDCEGSILILYLPMYLAEENAEFTEDTLDEFDSIVPPKSDKDTRDRRANKSRDLVVQNAPPIKIADEAWENWMNEYPSQHAGAGSFHHCIAWIPRGQAGHVAPMASSELRAAWRSKHPDAVPALLRHHIAKSVLDQALNDVVRRLHPPSMSFCMNYVNGFWMRISHLQSSGTYGPLSSRSSR
ncbi:hypothetical protein RhiJN_12466 [Ceratobasidium sp. AG-Ba]|nr:hypothetical protein RhiJN_12466 [Ceratobasidium sp. AG-Ba]